MEEWLLEEGWGWDLDYNDQDTLLELAEELAERFFLSDNQYLPDAGDDYNLGYLEVEDWWPLVNQLDESVDLGALVDLADALESQLHLPGLPTEILEAPLSFLESVLEGNLPLGPSGRRVDSRRLVKIALILTRLLREFPVSAQSAARAWADVHRGLLQPFDLSDLDEQDLDDFLPARDLPPAVTGFGLMLAMTLMRWPERADGMPLPSGFLEPEVYDEVYAQWEALPDSPTVTEEGVGEAEVLFAQGQLAHVLAQLGTVEGLDPDQVENGDEALAYSRLSRAILWLHDQCRICPERKRILCQAVTNFPERPVPLLDIASEIANGGRVEDCVRM
jgi:hypothetical protein